jgi:preprotein translocase subunit SecD
MIHIARWKIVLAFVLCALTLLYAAPNVINMEKVPGAKALGLKPITLGLDLQGGSHLLLRVELEKVLAERYEDLEQTLRRDLRKEKLGYRKLQASDTAVRVQLRDAKDADAVKAVIRKADPTISVTQDKDTLVLATDEQAMTELRRQTMDQSIEIVRRRIDESGTREPIIQRQGLDRIIVQLPGVDDPARIKALLGRTARLSFHLVSEPGSLSGRALPMQGEEGRTVTIERSPVLTGDMLTKAAPSTGQNGLPVVSFSLNNIGSRKFCDVTTQHTNKPFAIVLDEVVVSAPNINEPICGGSAQISGDFSFQETADLALLLRAGALPAPLLVMEERTVGPSLGRDSVTAGQLSTAVATGLVIVWMILNFGLFGAFAGVALVINLTMIIAVMSAIGATLSLPGIAGIVLTIGMAVDANVLIFARIREEFLAGKPVVTAIDSGYKQAMATIWDANMTTLIAGVFLFAVGAGPVKGFAVTLIIGLLASMYCAIVITRLMVIQWLRSTKPKTLKL